LFDYARIYVILLDITSLHSQQACQKTVFVRRKILISKS